MAAAKKTTATAVKRPVASAAPTNMGAPATPADYAAQWVAAAKAKGLNIGGPPAKPDPFLTPGQASDTSQFLGGLDIQNADITKQLNDLEADTIFQKSQIENTFQHQSSAANDNAAARGIFQSSLRDAALDDLRHTRTTNMGLLDDKLATAKTHADTVRRSIGDQRAERGITDTSQMGENAKAQNDVNLQAATPWAKNPDGSAMAGYTPPKVTVPQVKPATPGAPAATTAVGGAPAKPNYASQWMTVWKDRMGGQV